jgi:hypothetical protein
MALFDKLKTGLLGLKGQPGPNFENEGQRTSSNIQALAKNNALVSSQDLISGRTYGSAQNRTKVAPSTLDLNGVTPQQYTNSLGSSNARAAAQFNSSTGTGFTLDKRLPFSGLGLQGKTQPSFESVEQMTTSDIQAKAKNNILQSSQDLLTGRKYGKGRFTVFVPASTLDGSGLPINGLYTNKGPKEGRY